MKILVLNVIVLNDLFKQREIRRMIKKLNVDIICLVETRVRVENAENIKENVVPDWGFIHNYGSHILGKIWICWNLEIMNITTIQEHEQAVSCEIVVIKGG
jgi:hypothetical protein